MRFKKLFLSLFLIISLFSTNINLAFAITIKDNTNQIEVSKYPDFSYLYNGEDKFENFNRKMFNLNMKVNKYAIRPIHIVWASIMPKYGMERIQNAYTNLQYPKRLVSCLIQRDFKSTKNETIRFIANSTIGLAGMFDAAEHFWGIEAKEKGMDEALAKCKVKQGPYLVMPCISSTTPRGILGSILDNALNPSNYIGTPAIALVKLGFTVNRTYFMQPIAKMLESTYADPYDIAKKFYGLERYIKTMDLDKKEILNTSIELATRHEDIEPPAMNQETDENNNIKNGVSREKDSSDDGIKNTPNFTDPYTIKDPPNKRVNLKTSLKTNINLDDYCPQNPVIDAMRTALFEIPDVDKSIWSEFSIWNRSFSNRIKTASVSIDSTKDKYKYRYILQKDKTSPLAIIYPSIGEGINSHHSVILAKIFYDEGYSVIIQGSHFHWEFVKSMPDIYKPGLPSRDAEYLRVVTSKIINQLETKHKYDFKTKTIIGTSFGAMTALFVGDKEAENNTIGINKYISINPPIELLYAMKQIDKNTAEWKTNPDNLKERVAVTASKIIQISKLKNKGIQPKEILPFSDDEAKLITGFILHQKLSDLVFTLEKTSTTNKCDIYKTINNMDFSKYSDKYLVKDENTVIGDLAFETSLYSIADYLQSNNNYKIYHSLDDYLVNKNQLAQIKDYAKDKLVLLNNGSHLGFLYRKEFLAELKHEISQHKEIIAHK